MYLRWNARGPLLSSHKELEPEQRKFTRARVDNSLNELNSSICVISYLDRFFLVSSKFYLFCFWQFIASSLLTLWALRQSRRLILPRNWCISSTSYSPVSTASHRYIGRTLMCDYIIWHLLLYSFRRCIDRDITKWESRFLAIVITASVEHRWNGRIMLFSASTWVWQWSTLSSKHNDGKKERKRESIH